jgi:hypothetical protein
VSTALAKHYISVTLSNEASKMTAWTVSTEPWMKDEQIRDNLTGGSSLETLREKQKAS